MTLFERIVEEKIVIDPVIWLLRIQNNKVNESHEQYVRAMAKRHKNNQKIIKQLEKYFELWKFE
ncbi:hypothetical protein ABE272_19195 [Priestia aryabhattai]|uniref:hypothetical protein n=1 Tax=Priestia aryabhattai TaxID=412384 RepID=UPI003D2ADF6B